MKTFSAWQKIQKKIFLNKETRRKIVVDDSRFFNMRADFNYGDSAPVSKRISFTGGYLWNPRDFGTQDIFDFSTLTNAQKKSFLYRFFRASSHSAIDNKGAYFGQYLISSHDSPFVNIWIKNADNYILRSSGIKKFFVPKFYHNRASINFLKNFVFIKRPVPKLLNYLSEQWIFCRALYEYVKKIRFRFKILH